MEHEPMQPTSPSQRETLEAAVRTYTEAGTRDGQLAMYLEDRGITESVAATFRLGVVRDPAPGHDRFTGKLCIPYLSAAGYPLTVRFRCMEDHKCKDFGHGKYMSMPGDAGRMFNVPAIFAADDEIHLTEGEFDAIILNQLGLKAVAMPGATTWRPRHRVMLSGFSKVWVWGDPDDAGADFVNTVCRSLRQARGLRLRDGDVTDTYLQGGAEAICSLLNEARSIETA